MSSNDVPAATIFPEKNWQRITFPSKEVAFDQSIEDAAAI
jgi:hypothetical protein